MEDLTKTTPAELARRMREDGVVRDVNLDMADLSGFENEELSLERCSLKGTAFERLRCGSFRVANCSLQGASFNSSVLYEAEFTDSDCRSASFRGARLNLSKFDTCDLSLCSFDGASLFGVDLSGSRLWSVDLMKANIDAIVLDHASLRMANLRHKSLKDYTLVGVDLGEADLIGSNFTGAVFRDCILTRVVVSPTTRFDGADLRGALIDVGILSGSCKGATISSDQAQELVFEKFGLIVPELVSEKFGLIVSADEDRK